MIVCNHNERGIYARSHCDSRHPCIREIELLRESNSDGSINSLYQSRQDSYRAFWGGTDLNPYSGGHIFAYERMWEVVKGKLIPEETKMILDTWNGDAGDRWFIIRKLREYGADRIIAWYFITPVEFVEEWFWQKPGIAKLSEMRNRQGEGLAFYSEDAPRRDHKMFHQFASDIDSDGFDEVIRVNPVTMEPEHVLRLQTSLKS